MLQTALGINPKAFRSQQLEMVDPKIGRNTLIF
jgi:hypothetical protein